jgi:hypothetical protein
MHTPLPELVEQNPVLNGAPFRIRGCDVISRDKGWRVKIDGHWFGPFQNFNAVDDYLDAIEKTQRQAA